MAKTRSRRRRQLAIGAANEVRRTTFSGLPIVDAKVDFSLLIRTQNVKAAAGHEKDATNCVLAKACAEQVGATIVAFFRRTAYLELPDAKGVRRVVRYLLDPDAAAIVAAFDRGRSVHGEVTVTLRAPGKLNTLDAIRAKTRLRREAKRKALITGELEGEKYSPEQQRRFATPARIEKMDVRSGIGMVHNIVKKSAAKPGHAA